MTTDHRRLCRRCGQDRPLLDFIVKDGRLVAECAACRDERDDERTMLQRWVKRRDARRP
jgi:hypothetical protein